MQRYEQIACVRCGGTLKLQSDGMYKCEYCGAVFKEKAIDNYLHAICNGIHSAFEDVLDNQYQNEIGSIRQNLFAAVRKRDINGDEVVDYCRSLKKKIGDTDFYANFYEVATYGTVKEINAFLNSIDVAEQPEYAICDVLDYITNPMQAEILPSLRWLIERAFKNNSRLKEKYDTKLDEDEGLIKAGVYDETLPRDVFLAYKSEDIKYVNELCEYLEGQGLKCFLSSRNLKHGRNAKNLYEARLYRAIDHCTVVVFVSTHLSRTVGDARNLELTYIEEQDRQNAPAEYRHNYVNMPKQYKKPRVEYLKEDYVMGAANEDFARMFFKGYQRRESKEAVYNAVDEYRRISPRAENKSEYKYCKNCGAKNLLRAKFCSECGVGQEFADSEKEYLDYKEQQLKEKAAQTIKTAEAELRRKQEEAQKQLAEELKRRRQELEEEYRNKEEELKKKGEALRRDYEVNERAEANEWRKQHKETSDIESYYVCQYCGVEYHGDFSNLGGLARCTTCGGELINVKELKKYREYDSKVEIPYAITIIGKLAFYNRDDITSVIIPHSVTEIRESAFCGCTRLVNLVIPDSVTSIDASAFSGCRSLTKIVIPKSVTSIGKFVFKGCENLTIYCERKTKPSKWAQDWHCGCKVIWGYKGNKKNTDEAECRRQELEEEYKKKEKEQKKRLAEQMNASNNEVKTQSAPHEDTQALLVKAAEYYNAKDYENAVKLLKMLAEQGDATAQFRLGLCYYYGQGVEQLYAAAVKWYRKAAGQGQADAQCFLGICYEDGTGVKKSYKEAVKWYRKAAGQGQADAQNLLGRLYYAGLGVKPSYVQAVGWYRKAAEQGDVCAQFNLGHCYYFGDGVEQSYEEAVNWILKAAEQEYADAQYELGTCYEFGKGVEQSYEQAIRWYRKAAEQGHANAKAVLDRLTNKS